MDATNNFELSTLAFALFLALRDKEQWDRDELVYLQKTYDECTRKLAAMRCTTSGTPVALVSMGRKTITAPPSKEECLSLFAGSLMWELSHTDPLESGLSTLKYLDLLRERITDYINKGDL